MLASARSLGRRGVPFVTVGVTPRMMVARSRFLRGALAGRGPDPGAEPEAYAGFVLETARRFRVDLVLPLTDKTMLACDRLRADFDAEAPLAVAHTSALRNVLDKRVNLETARRLGIPCPDEYDVEHPDQIPGLVERLGFPLALKDPGPAIDGQRPGFKFRFLVARDEEDLAACLSRCPPGAYPLFQDFVEGTVHNVCCFAVDGEVVAAHEFRGVRSLRGMTCLREATPVTADLGEYAARMLGELRWSGAAHLGFIVGARDGVARYMETNGRFWGSMCGSVNAGWDFPYWTYRYFAHGELPKPPPLPRWTGRRSRWHYGELEALVRYLGGERQQSWVGRTRVRAVADYLEGFWPGIDADVFSADDPLPELAEHWREGRRYGTALLHGIGRRVVRRRATDPAPRRWG
jgi:predicted ATP-grasp superfamily ATP-dependent carboligase